MELQAGQLVLGRYRVERPLGKGAMGEVWRGVHEQLDMPVAIKVLLQHNEASLLERFKREARLMARVRHANVVQIFDFGLLEADTPCIVMELLSGVELDVLLQKPLELSYPEVAQVGAQILRGLAAMHEAGIVHRDIKPSNMMIFESANEVHLKLVDFGIAKPEAALAHTKLTQTGTLIGTPAYMAPEQLLGMDIGPKADIYAVGLILYEMLSGALPWGAETMRSIMRRVRDDVPHLPGDGPIHELVMRMLAFEPSERPDSLSAIARLDAVRNQPIATEQKVPRAQTFGAKRLRRRTMQRSHQPPGAPVPTQLPPPTPPPKPSPTHQAPPKQQTPLTQPAPPEPSPYPTTDSRTHALLVAKFPPSRLRKREERTWLRGLMADMGMGFSLGGQFWIALVHAHTQEDALAHIKVVRGALQERYAGLVTFRDTTVSEGFTLTAATLSGAGRLPEELQDLMSELS